MSDHFFYPSPRAHIRIPFYKRFLSYLYPVSLRKSPGAINSYLEVFLSRNQLQLATIDALYSDGDRYRPAIAALDHLKPYLADIRNVLVLGTGLGSMVRAMASKGYEPDFTLVDNDKVVLQWAIEFLEDTTVGDITPLCTDARQFMAQNTGKYDMVFVDIFSGRVVPSFVTTTLFLKQCLNSLNAGGHLIFNYIINDAQQWELVKNVCNIVMPGYKVIDMGVNRIIITQAPSV